MVSEFEIAVQLFYVIFFILGGISVMVNEVFRVTWGHALNPGWVINRIWCGMLGVDPPAGPGAEACVILLAAIVLLLALVLERKLRPVEVIS